MKKSLLSFATAAVFVAGAGLAAAQSSSSTTTTTWSNDEGTAFRQYSTTEHYNSINDPALNPTVGMALPGTVTVYPLPQTVHVQNPDEYSYTIVNNRPVVVERTTRKVVHTWDQQ